MAPDVLEEYDYVIVGGGLAGSSVASRLSRCGRVLLVQQSRPGLDGSATQAGLFNPIMAKQGRKVWRAGEALASFRVLVQDVGAEEWVSSGGILRPAMSPKQAKSFQDAARVNPDLCMWKDPEALVDRYPDVLCPFGGLWVQAGGAVNIPRYVDALHHDIVRNGSTVRRDFVTNWKNVHNTSVEISLRMGNAVRARTLVLATGAAFSDNAETSRLKLHRIKGQIVRVKRPADLSAVPLLSGSGYVVADGEEVVLGSSYDHDYVDLNVDQHATKKIIEKASRMIPSLAGAAIISAHVGLRVTVPGTYLPMVGPLDVDKNIWVVNGMGSKGLLMSAWIADRVGSFIRNEVEIPEEISVQRLSDPDSIGAK